MVYRLSPENVRSPRGGPSGALALLLVLGLVVGIWLFAGREPGTPSGPVGADPTAYASPDQAPTLDPVSGLPYVAPASLPDAALDLLVAVEDDRADGVPFTPAAGSLPGQQDGYYTEYAVPPGTPDAPGPQRLVAGEGGEVYWTDDAAVTFARVGP